MSDDEIIAVVKAHKEGKKIEVRFEGQSDWHEISHGVKWGNFQHCDYRVTLEPRKPREWMLNILPDGRVNTGALIPCRMAQDDGCKLVHIREVLENE